MRLVDRRRFLQSSAALTAGASALATATSEAAPVRRSGPNDALRVALIGVRGRGMEHLQGYFKCPDARITTLCDVDSRVVGKASDAVEKQYGAKPKYVQDLRRVFDDPEIDAVSIATPNHWHALATIWAVQAGKDVYVEKPVSHCVWEGRKMVEAARKYNKIVATGTQCRSHKGIQEAIEFVQSGKIGKVYLAKGLCYKWRPSIGMKDDSAVPAGLDYDLWCGPAEKKPFNENRLHYNWHWFWNTGNGDLGNQGIHQMDLGRWALGKNEFPKTVYATGGRFGYKDQAETPNTESVVYDYEDGTQLHFEVRGLPTNDEKGVMVGDIIYGSEGIVVIDSYTTWQSYMGQKMEKGPGGKGGGDHFNNFLQAVKSRNYKELAADIEEGHLSSAYCHLGNISYKLGRKLRIDPSTESFVGDSEANGMLKREYRAPFVVPDKV